MRINTYGWIFLALGITCLIIALIMLFAVSLTYGGLVLMLSIAINVTGITLILNKPAKSTKRK